jgi:hypothetical protein
MLALLSAPRLGESASWQGPSDRAGSTPPDCRALTGALGSGIGPPPWQGHDPRRPEAMISAATPSVPSHGDRDPTVLVVEEDDVARCFLAVIWRCCGASSTVAEPSLAGVIRGVI